MTPPTTAEDAWKRGDWQAAYAAYLAWLTAWVAGRDPAAPFTPAELAAAERTADLAVPFGDVETAGHLLDGLSAACLRAGNPFAARHAALKRAELDLVCGRPEDARARLARLDGLFGPLHAVPVVAAGLAVWEAGWDWAGAPPAWRPVLLTRACLCLGRLALADGCFQQADALLRRGSLHAGPASVPVARALAVPLRLDEADSRNQQGRPAEAAALLVGLEIDPVAEPGWHARRLELLGESALLSGRLGEALRHFTEVSAVCSRLGLREAARDALARQAVALAHANQLANAAEVLGRARGLCWPADDPAAAAYLDWLADRIRERARGQLAGSAAPVTAQHENLALAVGMPAELPDPPAPAGYAARFARRVLAVRRALGRGDVSAAARGLADAFSVFAESESAAVRARLLALKAAVCLAAGRPDLAAEAAGHAADEFDRLGLRPDRLDALRLLHAAAPEAGLARVVDGLEAELAATLTEAERLVWRLADASATDARLTAEADELARADRPSRERLLALLNAAGRDRRALDRVALGLPDRDTPEPFAVGAGRATLAFVVLPDRVVGVRLDDAGAGFVASAVPRVGVRRLVREFHEGVLQADPSASERAAGDLAAALRLPELLAGLPADVTALTIVPDDALHGFPFAALRIDGEFLVRRFALSLGTGDPPTPARGPADALVVAVPGGTRRPPAELSAVFAEVPPLPATTHEARSVAGWLQGRGVRPAVLTGPTRAELLAAWPTAGLVHIACHGVFRPDRPDASGLVMVPDGGPAEVVSLRDLAGLRPAGLHHVTLSCCWGADSFVAPGRWVLSLPTALRRAGAGSVLACLWPVVDVVGPAFAARFYRYCETLPRDEALRRTQLDCLGGDLYLPAGGPDVRHPFVWAGFVLHGDPSPLVLRGASPGAGPVPVS